MSKARIAIVGVGNCASSLVQGISYYSSCDSTAGLIHADIGGLSVADIEVASAFDVDARKVGRDLSEAIWLGNNNASKLAEVATLDVEVSPGPLFDGLGQNYRAKTAQTVEADRAGVVGRLRESGAEIIVNYLPVGSAQATRFWAEVALETRCAFVNCIPEFVASDPDYSRRFRARDIPLLGDDVKSQFGATLLHRIIVQHLERRGYEMERTYQLNFGGNMDFYNMLNSERLKSKKISKQQAVRSLQQRPTDERKVHIGPSDYVEWLEDNKWCYLHVDGRGFGGAPLKIEAKLEVCDSPNSAGVVVDLVRLAKLALTNKVGGPLDEVCAFYMKSPPKPMDDDAALASLTSWLSSATTS